MHSKYLLYEIICIYLLLYSSEAINRNFNFNFLIFLKILNILFKGKEEIKLLMFKYKINLHNTLGRRGGGWGGEVVGCKALYRTRVGNSSRFSKNLVFLSPLEFNEKGK